ncbi:hypothetical protein HYU17_02990 [Candidatus Woesearchaeota archaeon]|nr:hypothetical protein [Candidatus Woesearchaeota archaeon]
MVNRKKRRRAKAFVKISEDKAKSCIDDELLMKPVRGLEDIRAGRVKR